LMMSGIKSEDSDPVIASAAVMGGRITTVEWVRNVDRGWEADELAEEEGRESMPVRPRCCTISLVDGEGIRRS
jgi:hypothetical protein